MAIAAGLPKPAVYLIPDPDPNAFATGVGPERSSVAATRTPRFAQPGGATGSPLARNVAREELRRTGHDRRRRARRLGSLALRLGTARTLVGRRFAPLWRPERRRLRRSRSRVLRHLGALPDSRHVIAQLVAMAVSREREYLADASGAELTRNPLALASALEKIDAAEAPTASIKQGIAHLCIEDPRGRALNQGEEFRGQPLLDTPADSETDRAAQGDGVSEVEALTQRAIDGLLLRPGPVHAPRERFPAGSRRLGEHRVHHRTPEISQQDERTRRRDRLTTDSAIQASSSIVPRPRGRKTQASRGVAQARTAARKGPARASTRTPSGWARRGRPRGRRSLVPPASTAPRQAASMTPP